MVYLAYSGMQDMFLTEQPDFTHFKTVYSREMQFVSRTREIPFDQTFYRPGDTIVSTLPYAGDYITKLSLKVVLPQLTPTSSTWIYAEPPIGTMYFYLGDDSIGASITTLGLYATSITNSWYITSGGVSVTAPISSNMLTFTFSPPLSISYVVFSSIELANFWGFAYNYVNLFGGYVRFPYVISNRITLQESGWLQGSSIYTSDYSYLDDTVYKLINSVSLYIGKQLVQEFDSTYIKSLKETSTTYKNRPVLKLLEGDTNIVDFKRTYYFEITFIDIPIHALSKHNIQIRLKTNPLTYIDFYSSVIVDFNFFSDVSRLPTEYEIIVPQVSLFTEKQLDIRNPMRKLIITGSDDYKLRLNGEFFIDSDTSNVSCFENLTNIPTTSNVIVFNNPINMSRFRDQKFESNTVNVYVETLNVMRIQNDLSGLLFDTTDTSRYPLITGTLTNPLVSVTDYLFNKIQNSVPNILNFCSLRIVNPVYTGPVIRLRVGNLEDDFYTDVTQSFLRNSNGVSVSDWAGISTIYVVIWYDQFISLNNLYQDDQYYQPTLVKENSTYVIKVTNSTATVIPPTQYLKLTTPLYIQQFVIQFKVDNNSRLPIFSNQSDYKLMLLNRNIRGENGVADWINFPGAGNVYWKINNLPGSTSSPTNTIVPLTWSTCTSYATNMPSYDVSMGGPITDVTTRKIFFTSDQTFSGSFFEIGFLSGTSLSVDDSTYYTNRKII